MKEQLISFETAKLAKDKEFYEPCFYYFSLEGDEKEFIEDGYYFKSLGENGRLILRPTQTLLTKWIRDKCNIFINIFPIGLSLDSKNGYRFKYEIIDLKELKIIQDDKSLLGFLTYEEALEIALQQSLKLI